MTRSTSAKFAATVALAAMPAAVLTVAPQATANADSCSDADTNMPLAMDSVPVPMSLRRTGVGSQPSPNLLDRAQEVAGIQKVSFTMNPSEQLVDIRGDTAVIHGVNTLIAGGKVIARERFTDVFVLQNGTWIALSAQETTHG
jgi:hypothetical protein